MPSAVAVLTNLTYGAVDLQDFPRIFLEVVEGGPDATPETRGENRTMPYYRGQIYAPRRATRLPIMLKGFVAGQGANEAAQRSDTAAARAELKALFDVEGGPQTLSVDTEDGVTYTAEAYPEVVVWESEPRIPTRVGVTVRLVAIDPPEWTAGS